MTSTEPEPERVERLLNWLITEATVLGRDRRMDPQCCSERFTVSANQGFVGAPWSRPTFAAAALDTTWHRGCIKDARSGDLADEVD